MVKLTFYQRVNIIKYFFNCYCSFMTFLLRLAFPYRTYHFNFCDLFQNDLSKAKTDLKRVFRIILRIHDWSLYLRLIFNMTDSLSNFPLIFNIHDIYTNILILIKKIKWTCLCPEIKKDNNYWYFSKVLF